MEFVILTGRMGAGKSTVLNLFEQYGVKNIQTDGVAKQIRMSLETNSWLCKMFGHHIQDENRRIDTDKLRRLLMFSPDAMALFSAHIHPRIIQRVEQLVKSIDDTPYVIIEFPFLKKIGTDSVEFMKHANSVISLNCEPSVLEKRIANRNPNISPAEMDIMLSSQMDDMIRKFFVEDELSNSQFFSIRTDTSSMMDMAHDVETIHKQIIRSINEKQKV